MNLHHTPDYVPPVPRERQHECGDCHKTFAHRGNLLKHMVLHDPDTADNPILREALEKQIQSSEEQFANGSQVKVLNVYCYCRTLLTHLLIK